MPDEKDALPSDAEKGSLKPKEKQESEPTTPPPKDKQDEADPSEQPS